MGACSLMTLRSQARSHVRIPIKQSAVEETGCAARTLGGLLPPEPDLPVRMAEVSVNANGLSPEPTCLWTEHLGTLRILTFGLGRKSTFFTGRRMFVHMRVWYGRSRYPAGKQRRGMRAGDEKVTGRF